MMYQSADFRWAPLETTGWSRFAYGHCVMFRSEGGTLATTLRGVAKGTMLYLRAAVEGRMLIEVYFNGRQLHEELVACEDLDCFINLPHTPKDFETQLEVHFIPATSGEVRIMRSVELVSADTNLQKSLLEARGPVADLLM